MRGASSVLEPHGKEHMASSPELKKAVFKIHTFLENFDSNPDPATPGLRAPIELHTNKK